MHGDADVWSPHKHELIHMDVLVFHKCHMLMLIHWWITKAPDYGQEKGRYGMVTYQWVPFSFRSPSVANLLGLGLVQTLDP